MSDPGLAVLALLALAGLTAGFIDAVVGGGGNMDFSIGGLGASVTANYGAATQFIGFEWAGQGPGATQNFLALGAHAADPGFATPVLFVDFGL